MDIRSIKKKSPSIKSDENFQSYRARRPNSNSKITKDQIKILTEEFTKLNINPRFILHRNIISSKLNKNKKIIYNDLNLKYFSNYKKKLLTNLKKDIIDLYDSYNESTIIEKSRIILINWILEILKHHLKNYISKAKNIFFRMIMIFDKFIKEQIGIFEINDIPLWAIIAMNLAIKQELKLDDNNYVLNFDNFNTLTKNSYSKNDFLKAEETILEILEYKVGFLSYLEILHFFLLVNCFNCLPENNFECFKEMAETILIMVISNFDALNLPITVLVNAVLLYSLKIAFKTRIKILENSEYSENPLISKKEEYLWTQEIVNNSRIEEDLLFSVFEDIKFFIDEFYNYKNEIPMGFIHYFFKFEHYDEEEI